MAENQKELVWIAQQKNKILYWLNQSEYLRNIVYTACAVRLRSDGHEAAADALHKVTNL